MLDNSDSEDELFGERIYTAGGRTESIFESSKHGLDSKRVFKAVVAIDFGTTRTGMLIALRKKGSEEPTVFTPDWNQGADFAETYSVKTDCSLLLDTNGDFIAFGERAREKAQRTFSKAYERSRDDYWHFFEHFKMALHKSKHLDTAMIASANNYKLKASVVFGRALWYLRETAMAILQPMDRAAAGRWSDSALIFGESETDYGLPVDECDVRWVLTVPAIWSEDAKDFMRKCAFDAGMGADSEQLILLYEPEAACISLQLQLRSEAAAMDSRRPLEGTEITLIKKGDVYLVLDCGGGTVDVVAHEWFAPFEVREVMPPTGGDFGSIYVEKEFQNLLADIFGESLTKFQKELPSGWLRLKDACVKAKESFAEKSEDSDDEDSDEKGDDSDDDDSEENGHYIELTKDFVDFVKKKNVKKCVKRSGKDVRVIGRGSLGLLVSDRLMAAMFDKVVDKIRQLLEQLLWDFESELRKLRYVFVVGGFAESKYLQKRLAEVLSGFEGIRLLVPKSPALAVVRGAANVECIRTVVKARVLRRTYGRRVDIPVSEVSKWESKPDISGRIHSDERSGTQYVSNCFQVIAKRGDLVECGHSVNLTCVPATKTSTAIPVEVYFSDEQTEDHLLPLEYEEYIKHAVGGKSVSLPFPEWFDASKGEFISKFTFAEERELQLEVTLKCGDRTEVTDVDPVTYDCVGDKDIFAVGSSAST